jgi:hypothetical protein
VKFPRELSPNVVTKGLMKLTKDSDAFYTYTLKLKCLVEGNEKMDLTLEISRTPVKYGLGKRLHIEERHK